MCRTPGNSIRYLKIILSEYVENWYSYYIYDFERDCCIKNKDTNFYFLRVRKFLLHHLYTQYFDNQ